MGKAKVPKGLIQQQERRQALAERATRTPASPASPVVPPWRQDAAGRVEAVRAAEHWHRLPGKHVHCTLCYRDCRLAPGAAGWCKIRRNDGGRLAIPEHGVIANAQPHVTHYHFWRNHSRMAWISGVSCTAACSFCTSTRMAWSPDRMPWAFGERAPGYGGGWAYVRAMLHPQGAIKLARDWHCSGVYLGGTESSLVYEYVCDVARLAKAGGLFVSLDTNAFTSPAAIRALAPHIDMVYVGVKGHLDPGFYEKRMRSPGAVPHVRAAMKEWRAAPGVHRGLSDVVSPPHWVPEATAVEQMRRFYTWVAETLGPLTPLEVRGMVKPEVEYGEWFQPLLPRGASLRQELDFYDRIRLAERTARECGLVYAYSHEHRTVRCHHCDGVLVGRIGWVNFDLHVGPDGVCGHCGGQTPIVGISRAEYEEIQREHAAETAAAAAS